MTMKANAAVMVVAMTMMMIGMTTANKSEVRSHRRSRRAMCSEGKKIPVKICVKTAELAWDFGSRGTDSNVMVRLNGPYCYSPYIKLESPQDDFETGDYDCYTIYTWDIAKRRASVLIKRLESVQVKLDPHKDDWLMDYMTLRYNNAMYCLKYYLHEWFTDSTPKTLPEPSSIECGDYKLND
ncbi:hypothetical protein V1264_017788 [Littorina saxatilis]|uniref:Uncharacterized protein n=1 Tax=Littorina saxatilis TaxID=31220 RepID=A0AAN9BHT4_9CAEN